MNSQPHAGVCPYCLRRNKAQTAPERDLAGNLFGLSMRGRIGQHDGKRECDSKRHAKSIEKIAG